MLNNSKVLKLTSLLQATSLKFLNAFLLGKPSSQSYSVDSKAPVVFCVVGNAGTSFAKFTVCGEENLSVLHLFHTSIIQEENRLFICNHISLH